MTLRIKKNIEAYGNFSGNLKPEVSIVVPTYNHEYYIEKCLEGILAQKTDFDYEIIIGEDASTDGTREICKRLADANSDRIRLILHRLENKISVGGKPTGRFNILYCFQQARGKYIAVCEGDDYWTDDLKLQKQYNFLENNSKYAICCSNARILSDNVATNGQPVHPQISGSHSLGPEDFLENSRIVTCTAMFKNVGYEEIPDSWLKIPAGDWYHWIYIMQKSRAKTWYSNEFTAVYREHASGIFSSLNEIEHHWFYVKNLKIIKELFSGQSMKKLVNEKQIWHLTAILRLYAAQGRKIKSLSLALPIFSAGAGIKYVRNLIFEIFNPQKFVNSGLNLL